MASNRKARIPVINEAPRRGLDLPPNWWPVFWVIVCALLVLKLGFSLPIAVSLAADSAVLVAAVLLVTELIAMYITAPDTGGLIRKQWYEFAILALALYLSMHLLLFGSLGWLDPLFRDGDQHFLATIAQMYLIASLFLRMLHALQKLLDTELAPELVFAGSFLAIIVLGTVLLWLPNATAVGREAISLLDAFFTSTSAVCVTGLIVRDTGGDFSNFGQMVIMFLFQIGGMGIITFVAVLSIMSGSRFSIPQTLVLRDLVGARAPGDVRRQIIMIFGVAGTIEIAGMLSIFAATAETGWTLMGRLKWSMFHAVSAFCNAGFGLESDSMSAYGTNILINISIMLLIVIGGLSFPVMRDLMGMRLGDVPAARRIWSFGRPRRRLQLQTKLALIVTAVLLLAGTIIFMILEWNHQFASRNALEALLYSAFQSVTCRTAGFNTLPIEELQGATLILMMLLMVIGAGPLSTGGGVKTTTFGVMFLAMRSLMKSSPRVEFGNRSIPAKVVNAAISVFLLYVITAIFCLFLISLTDPRFSLQEQAFEVISALSTVGLSMGITGELSPLGKLVLCFAMYVGRIGPLTIALSIFRGRRQNALYQYPEEVIIVG